MFMFYVYELSCLRLLQAVRENNDLKNQLDEKVNEVVVLKEQNAVYVADFQQEREDRERSQSRVIDLEQQLAVATQRIVELENEVRHFSMTTRRQVSSVLYSHCLL